MVIALNNSAQAQVVVSGQIGQGPEGEHTLNFNFDGPEPASFERLLPSGGFSEEFDVPDSWTGGSISILGCENNPLNDYVFSRDTIPGNQFMAYLTHCEPTVFGCTDSEAVNFNPSANWGDDDSCIYLDCDDNVVRIDITTGSAGGTIGWEISNENQVLIEGSGYSGMNYYQRYECLADGCFEISLTGNYYTGTNSSIEIILDDDIIFSVSPEAGDPDIYSFGINTDDCPDPDISGCTDPIALNYNPQATVDDGSCVYPNECVSELDVYSVPGNCDEFTVQAVWAGTSNSGAWSLDDVLLQEDAGNVNFELDEAGTYTLCYLQNELACPENEEICIDLTVTEECLQGCADSLNLFTNDTSCTVQGVLYGGNIEDLVTWDFGEGSEYLIDQNYMTHPYEGPGEYEVCATVVNEACPQSICRTISLDCEFDWNCSVELSLEVSEDDPNTIMVTYDHSPGIVYGHFWIFGDGTTSTSSTPSHFYEDDGPYTLCLNLFMRDENFVPCMDQACVDVSAEILESGFLGEGGFTVNVVTGGLLSSETSIEASKTKVYPNPAQNVIQFDLRNDQSGVISIYDSSGRIVKQIHSYTSGKLIAIDELNDGLYFIFDSDGNSQKFVVAR